jgi:hypothetical protein
MLSVGRCGVARLQVKVVHVDGVRCFTDGTSILVKIKSVALYTCQMCMSDFDFTIYLLQTVIQMIDLTFTYKEFIQKLGVAGHAVVQVVH